MLTERRVHTTIPAADMERAERWYEEKLGFKPIRKLQTDTEAAWRFIVSGRRK
jgi:catechol 2,3-dioxygenase-like lactoylglutathione lyase family enzyme